MAIPVIPIVVIGLAGLAWHQSSVSKKGIMTPQREMVFNNALKTVKDPEKLRKLADAFECESLPAQATLLRKRAALRELPNETKEARREAFKKGMKSKDIAGVEKLAGAFEGEGATGAAEALRNYAKGLAASQKAA